MSTHLEIEYKQLLTKNIYEQIKKDYFENGKEITQTNYYFQDTKGILSNKRYSLRVRELNNTYEFTLKIPQGFSKLEYNEIISKDNFENLKNKSYFDSLILNELKKINISIQDLTILTALSTYRLEIEFKGGVLCIDESHYQNKTDYEIEYEAVSEQVGKEIFIEILNHYGLTYTINCPGKFTRALQALSEN